MTANEHGKSGDGDLQLDDCVLALTSGTRHAKSLNAAALSNVSCATSSSCKEKKGSQWELACSSLHNGVENRAVAP